MEQGTYSIEKSTVECYKIRHSSGMYWADITIDCQGKTGRIQIASDYGDYQRYWGAYCTHETNHEEQKIKNAKRGVFL